MWSSILLHVTQCTGLELQYLVSPPTPLHNSSTLLHSLHHKLYQLILTLPTTRRYSPSTRLEVTFYTNSLFHYTSQFLNCILQLIKIVVSNLFDLVIRGLIHISLNGQKHPARTPNIERLTSKCFHRNSSNIFQL